VHQWNIDGKSKHEILVPLQELTMALSAYKARHVTGPNAATAVGIGFSGQFKY